MVEPTTLTTPSASAPLLLGLAQGRQRVGRLAGLADGDDDRAFFDDRVAIAELAGVLDLGGDLGQVLEEVLADQPRVPGRALRR